MDVEMTNLWIEDNDFHCALRVDFSNDRHYRVVIQNPGRADQVATALLELASMIGRDPLLVPDPTGSRLLVPQGSQP